MRTHIAIKAADPMNPTAIDSKVFESIEVVLPVQDISLQREMLNLTSGRSIRYAVTTGATRDRCGWWLTKEEYNRVKRLLTDPMENLDGELARD